MEIQKNNKQGLTKVSVSVSIQYNVLEESGEPREMSGSVYKDAKYVGMITAYPDGRISLYLEERNTLTGKERKSVFSAAVDDAETVFAKTPDETNLETTAQEQ